jgi:hypothetical protein
MKRILRTISFKSILLFILFSPILVPMIFMVFVFWLVFIRSTDGLLIRNTPEMYYNDNSKYFT